MAFDHAVDDALALAFFASVHSRSPATVDHAVDDALALAFFASVYKRYPEAVDHAIETSRKSGIF